MPLSSLQNTALPVEDVHRFGHPPLLNTMIPPSNEISFSFSPLPIFPLLTLDIPLLFFYYVTGWLRNYLVTEEGT
jgi:hypothetical protein